MKILLITEGLTDNEMVILKRGVDNVKTLLPQLEFIYKTTDESFSSIPFSNNVASGYVLDNREILYLVDGNYDIACLVYDWTLVSPQPTNPATSLIKKNNCIPMAIPKQWYNGYAEVFTQFFLHELSHAEAFRSGKKDLTHDKYNSMWTGRWNSKTNIDYYMFLLESYMKKEVVVEKEEVKKYKYFSPREIVGLKPELVELLDKARGLAGIPFVINSGYRTKDHNNEVGGIENSSHINGLAVDLRARNSNEHFLITKALFEAGFTRVSKKYPNHIHCDIDSTKTQEVLF